MIRGPTSYEFTLFRATAQGEDPVTIDETTMLEPGDVVQVKSLTSDTAALH